MTPETPTENTAETTYEIEKMADLKQLKDESRQEITFDNEGNMVYHNRAFERNRKRLWRAVMEGKSSIHHYTKPSGKDKPKTSRRTKKIERQNRKKGRNIAKGRK